MCQLTVTPKIRELNSLQQCLPTYVPRRLRPLWLNALCWISRYFNIWCSSCWMFYGTWCAVSVLAKMLKDFSALSAKEGWKTLFYRLWKPGNILNPDQARGTQINSLCFEHFTVNKNNLWPGFRLITGLWDYPLPFQNIFFNQLFHSITAEQSSCQDLWSKDFHQCNCNSAKKRQSYPCKQERWKKEKERTLERGKTGKWKIILSKKDFHARKRFHYRSRFIIFRAMRTKCFQRGYYCCETKFSHEIRS